MKPAPRLPEDQAAVAHWTRAGTATGRFGLRLRLLRKRLLWTVVVGGAGLLKRGLDVIVSACALLALLPVFAATALAIKFEDRGPLFFQQTRVGLRGRAFGMWKFRSMVPNAEKLKDQLLQQNEMQGGVTFKMKNDPRITRVGRFIRKFSVDELPQFWNVLRGDMSLVGPRPPVPREVALYAVDDRQRLLAKPGLTCFWQVGGRSEIDFAGQVRLDVQYIQSTSFWLDVKLLVMTVPAVLLGKGSY
jgi:lipopolysaccharide/colanic/teichoic acid biosynthesis glycosyltransferase